MNRRVFRVAVAAALLAGAAGPVLSATQADLTLSGFSVSLKDLNTADGVTPTLSWNDAATLYDFAGDSTQNGWTEPGPSMQPVWVDGGTTNGSHGATWSGSSALGFSTTSGMLDGQALAGLSLSSTLAAGSKGSASITYGNTFTLSPGSQVTFSYVLDGTLTGSSSAGLWTLPTGGFNTLHSTGTFGSTIYAGVLTTSLSSTGSNDWMGSTDAYETVIDGQVMKLTLRNTDSVAKTYGLTVGISFNGAEALAPVPEPASYALMALGLVAVAAAAKRRRG